MAMTMGAVESITGMAIQIITVFDLRLAYAVR